MTTKPAPAKPRKSGWTPERRRKQVESIRRWKPWAKSTGPRTAEGKSRARYNAWKHGLRGVHHRRVAHALRVQSAFLRYIEAWLRCEKIKNSNKRTIGAFASSTVIARSNATRQSIVWYPMMDCRGLRPRNDGD